MKGLHNLMISRKYILILILILYSFVSYSSNFIETGMPLIRNYNPKEYKADSQNRCVVQDKRGILYFANGFGVLEYDGARWRLISTSDKNYSTIDALAMDSSGIIYAASNNEFGYLKPDSKGKTIFVSLIDKFSNEDRRFNLGTARIKIRSYKSGIYFNTDDKLFKWDGKKVSKWHLGKNECFYGKNYILIYQVGIGLSKMQKDSIIYLKGNDKLIKTYFTGFFECNDEKVLLYSPQTGLCLIERDSLFNISSKITITNLNTKANKFLKENDFFYGNCVFNKNTVLTTERGGTILIDSIGNILALLNKSTGLINETNYYAFIDDHNSLWLSNDIGISRAEINAPISFWNDSRGVMGSVMSVMHYNNKVYIATWLGVSVLTIDNSENITLPYFKQISGINKPCWNLKVIKDNLGNERLLVASVQGLYEITKENKLIQLSDLACYYILQSKYHNNVWVGCNNGVLRIEFADNKIVNHGRVFKNKISERVHQIYEEDKSELWISTKFHGLYKVNFENTGLNGNYEFSTNYYEIKDGLSNLGEINICKVKNNTYFVCKNGVFVFANNKFHRKLKIINQLVDPSYYIINIVVSDNGDIWFQIGSRKYWKKIIGVARKKNDSYEFEYAPFKPIPEMDLNCIYVDGNKNTWFGGDDGLYKYDNNVKIDYKTNFTTLIRKVTIGSDSVVFWGTYYNGPYSDTTKYWTFTQPNELKTKIAYEYNKIEFEYAAPSCFDEKTNMYSYKLVGAGGDNENWSLWTNESRKTYERLPFGKYTFKVKSKNIYGVENESASFEFSILPPWYQTIFAYIIYFIIIGLVIFFILRSGNKRILNAKNKLELLVKERTEEIVKQQKLIEKEKEKAEMLLMNILPTEIAEELKINGHVKAQYYDNVTVFFADFKNFSKISEYINPLKLIAELDKSFAYFDDICAKYNLEKIKTIGDAYMCAGGIPLRNETHFVDAILAAMEIQQYMRKAEENQWLCQLRIGIHTGDLIAGVVGKNKFAYDIWGDTVNTASRMETAGEVGKINISGDTYEYVKKFFVCTYRGKIPVKNKGDIDMYFVERINPGLSSDLRGYTPNEKFYELLKNVNTSE